VVKNEQQAGAHKTTGARSHDHKETRNLQHTDQTSRRRPSVGKILQIQEILRKLLNKELVYKILVS
jgi:hypothetical protein